MAVAPSVPHQGISQREFVVLVAALIGIGALGVDLMLPALPAIGSALGLRDPNEAQLVISAYSFGFGATQLVWGPLADRFGRKPVLFVALTGFAIAAAVCAVAPSFTLLVGARAVQGMMAASTRVLVQSVVRDCYSGRHMARVMSMANMIFFAVPILAPSLGALVLTVAPWRWTFWTLAILATIIVMWTGSRLPETLHPGDRRALAVRPLVEAWSATLRSRLSIGYALASTALFGALLGYINSSEQIVGGVFRAPQMFPVAFAGIAAGMGLANFANSRLVVRLGTRRLSHGALMTLIGISLVHLAVVLAGRENLATFLVFQAAQMSMVALTGSNFAAMAMEDVGHFAGTAASVQGFLSGVGGALIGVVIGQAFDGSTLPVTLGFVVAGLVALALVLWTERGRLFRAHHDIADPVRS